MKIMFAGKKRAGKDTAAAYFKAWYGGSKFSFAEPLYDIMYHYQDTIGVPRHKDRKFLQTIGDLARHTDPLVWINLCFTKASHVPPRVNTYITDGRYLNELEAAKSRGYIVIQITADDDVRKERLDPEDSIDDSHASENGYPADYPFFATISNNGTIEEFHTQLKELAAQLTKKPKH